MSKATANATSTPKVIDDTGMTRWGVIDDVSDSKGKPRVGSLEVVKVVRDFIPVVSDEYGSSFGAILDQQMEMAAERGEEIQDVTLHVSPEYWAEFSEAVRASHE